MAVRFMSRADWGAGPMRAGAAAPHSQFVGLVLHHTVIGTRAVFTWDQAAAYMRQLQTSRPDLGNEVPYSLVTFPVADPGDCIVAEGRGFGRTGAHTAGLNSTRYGVAYPGNTENVAPTAGVLAGVRWVGARLHNPTSAVATTGHRDHKATACPGRHLYAALPQLQPPFRTPAPSPPKDGFLMALTDKQQDQIYQWAKEAALGTRADSTRARSGNYVGRDTRHSIKPGVEQLLARKTTHLVAATDWKPGEDVYLTDFATKVAVVHFDAGGELHSFLRSLAKLAGSDPNAVRIDRKVLEEIPTVPS